MISYETDAGGLVVLEVFDILGARVFSRRENVSPGRATFVWDGNDRSGVSLPGGLYFVRASSGDVRRTVKAVLLK